MIAIDEANVIPGYEHYLATSDGRILSIRRGLKEAKTNKDRDGYFKVNVNSSTKHVHRLVCLAFMGAPKQDGLVVRHLDGNRTNNQAINLRWGTPIENSADMLAHGNNRAKSKPETYTDPAYRSKMSAIQLRSFASGERMKPLGELSHFALLKSEDVRDIRARLAIGKHGTARVLAKEYGVSESAISDIKKGRSWSHLK